MSTYFLKGTWNGASFRVEKEFYRIIFAKGNNQSHLFMERATTFWNLLTTT
jgi:hypothetical protein